MNAIANVRKWIYQQRLTRSNAGSSPNGIPLPPVPFRMGGENFRENAAFVQGALMDIEKLRAIGLHDEAAVLDWGCGAGRLAIGLLETWPKYCAGYLGVDVQQDLVRWADRHLGRNGVDFVWVDAGNERYNPKGPNRYRIPANDHSFDVIYAYSVLSHMRTVEVEGYLREFRRILKVDGVAWVTAFVEDGVAPEVENPEDYGKAAWVGPLHCVRFESNYFATMVAEAGLSIEKGERGGETDGQTAFILRPLAQPRELA